MKWGWDLEDLLYATLATIAILAIVVSMFVSVRKMQPTITRPDTVSGELAVGIYGGSDRRIMIGGTMPDDWRICVFNNERDVENCVTVGALRGTRSTGNVLR